MNTRDRESRASSPPAQQLSPRLQRLARELESTFLVEGFLHLGINDLARRMRCSKRTLYALASSREELVEVLIERYLSRIRIAGNAAVETATDWTDAIKGYVDAPAEATRSVGSQFVNDISKFGPAHRQMRRHQMQRIAGLELLVSAGVKGGAFAKVDPKLFAGFMVHASNLMIDPDFLHLVHRPLSEACREIYKLLLEGLLPRDNHNPGRSLSRTFLDERKSLSRKLWDACPPSDSAWLRSQPGMQRCD